MAEVRGFSINEASRKAIIKKLENLASGVRRNAMASAVNAGARVVRNSARSKAPACIAPSIKVVRRKQANGAIVASVIAGNSRSWGKDDSEIESVEHNLSIYTESATKSRSKKFFNGLVCPPAFWIEFGTYGNRNLAQDPYTADTMKKMRYIRGRPAGTYAQNGGKSPSPYWFNGGTVNGFNYWTRAKPFLRPALFQATRSGAVERAMVKKLNEHFAKQGV